LLNGFTTTGSFCLTQDIFKEEQKETRVILEKVGEVSGMQ